MNDNNIGLMCRGYMSNLDSTNSQDYSSSSKLENVTSQIICSPINRKVYFSNSNTNNELISINKKKDIEHKFGLVKKVFIHYASIFNNKESSEFGKLRDSYIQIANAYNNSNKNERFKNFRYSINRFTEDILNYELDSFSKSIEQVIESNTKISKPISLNELKEELEKEKQARKEKEDAQMRKAFLQLKKEGFIDENGNRIIQRKKIN